MSEHHIDFPADTKQNPTPLGALISQSYRNEALKKKQNRQRKRIALGLLSLILIGLAYFGFFYPATRDYLDNFLHKKSSGLGHDWQSRINSKKETMSCDETEVDWDGPSSFKTRAQNFKLAVSGGKLSGPIEVVKEDVDQVELRIEGFVFYDDKSASLATIPIQSNNGNGDILHRGLRIEIKKTITDFSATIHLEDKGDDGSGTKKPVSAFLFFKIVFPKDYDSYKSLTIETNPIPGEQLDIFIPKALEIEFTNLDIHATSGKIQIKDTIITENLKTYSYQNTFIHEVKPARGDRITISSSTVSEKLHINVLTGPVGGHETEINRVIVGSKTGEVAVKIRSDKDTKPGPNARLAPIDVSANTVSGAINLDIAPADESQAVLVYARSVTGVVQSTLSDDYSGSIDLTSDNAEVDLIPKEDSKSVIEFDEKSSYHIQATKYLSSSTEIGDGSITLFSKRGDAKVTFV